MQQDLIESDPANAVLHRDCRDNYAREAKELRRKVGWGRSSALAFVGVAVGMVAWRFRSRQFAALLSLTVMATLLFLSEADQRLRWEEKLSLIYLAFILSATVLLAAMTAGAGYAVLRWLFPLGCLFRRPTPSTSKPAPAFPLAEPEP
jgi:hypothetical protein